MSRLFVSFAVLGWLGGSAALSIAQPPPPEPPRSLRQPPPPAPTAERDVGRRQTDIAGDPLTHGPVHEAFAAPAIPQPAPPQAVGQLPPQLPEEVPPLIAPERATESTRWIPGYWGWDDRDRTYVWVSGTWRIAPPEMEWVPGYWATVKGEGRWVPGFWAYAGEEEVAYLPPPPALRDEQPTASPDDDHFWVPGNWQYVEDRYEWKHGFWAPLREGWVWNPDCYLWSPRGYVFARGYWDFPLEQRGILFAPVAAQERAIARVAPTVVIDVREALAHWFVAPGYRHYCFGDYYDVDRRKVNIASWYDRSAPRFDSLRSYYARHDQQWFSTLKTRHDQCLTNASYRPAGTWREYGSSGAGRMAFTITGDRLPAGIVRFDVSGADLASVLDHYVSFADQRAEFERGAVIAEGRQPVFAQFDSFAPPGHGGLPPGQAKKGLVPPGFGGAPPGQTKKLMESYAPIFEKGPKYKEKFGGPGKGKGKGKGK
jgi:hypothetical protein